MNDQIPTVCIIDDDGQFLSSLTMLLEVAGFNVTAFESAEAFLENSSVENSDEFSCLVLDVRLPGMSGIELLTELNSRGTTVPVVMVSGHADEDVVELGLANGAQTLFEKPFEGRKLVEAVKNAVSQSE